MHKKIDVYDFDGTIYDGDSTVDFFLFSLRRNPKILFQLPIIIWYAFLYFTHIISLQSFKSHFFLFVKFQMLIVNLNYFGIRKNIR